MQPETFQFHCQEWFDELHKIYQTLLDVLSQSFLMSDQTDQTNLEHQRLENALLPLKGKITSFLGSLRTIEDSLIQQLSRNPWTHIKAKKNKNTSFELLSEIVELPKLEKKVALLPNEYSCRNQLQLISKLLRSILLLTGQYEQDYEKITWENTEMIMAMGKIITLHLKRSFINTFVSSMERALKEITTEKIPKELQQISRIQQEILQSQTQLYQHAFSTFDLDIQHFQQLIRMLATIPFQTQHLVMISKRLMELSLLGKGWMSYNKSSSNNIEMKMFPILEDIHEELTQILNMINWWVSEYVRMQKKEQPQFQDLDTSEEKNPLIQSLTKEISNQKGKFHLTLLLNYVDKMNQEEKNQATHLEESLNRLNQQQELLKEQIQSQFEKEKKAFEQCLVGKASESKLAFQNLSQVQSLVNPNLAQKLVSLDSKLESLRFQRQFNRQKILEKSLQQTHSIQNVDTLQHILHFLKLWEEREEKYRQLIRQELALVSSWKNLRQLYFFHLHDKKNKWYTVSKMELSSMTLSNQLIIQQIFSQLREFESLQWQLLQEKQKEIFKKIGILSITFQRMIKQISMLCPQDSKELSEQFQKIEFLLSQLESYWIVRYQREMSRAFRKNASFLYSLVSLLIQENRSPESLIYQYTLTRQQIEKLLQQQQDQISQFSFPKLDTHQNFQNKFHSISDSWKKLRN